MLLLGCGAHVLDGAAQTFLDTLGQVLELIQIVAHLLLALKLGGHHSCLQLLLLLVGSRLTGLARFFKELKAVRNRLLVHTDTLL